MMNYNVYFKQANFSTSVIMKLLINRIMFILNVCLFCLRYV